MTSTGVKNLINLNEVKFSRGLFMKVTYHSVYIDYDLKLKTKPRNKIFFMINVSPFFQGSMSITH